MAKKVLIIEDEADIRTVYAEVLREEGYEVDEAGDGSSGLQKAFDGNWDILLLDIILPGSDGLNVLKKVKANEAVKDRPVILLTNLGAENIINDCFELGAAGYLIKSEITPDKIVAEVNSFIGISPQQ